MLPSKPRKFLTPKQRIAQARRALFNKRFANTTRAISDDILKIITKGVSNERSGDAMVSEIVAETGVPKYQAENIVRNESHSMRSMVREIRFLVSDPNGMEKYVWQVTRDKRLTPICRKIADRTKNGVTLDRLKEIIADEADQKTFRDANPYLPHLGCRSVARRKFG